MEKTAVVVGGCGFIGLHLVEGLVERGYKVQVLDRVGPPKGSPEGVEFTRVGLTEAFTGRRRFLEADYVFHLAALVGVDRSVKSPRETFGSNVQGLISVLEACKGYDRVKKVVFASSAAVYGPEHSPYSWSKHLGEDICEYYRRYLGIPVACLRFFNVYGPRQDSESQYSAVVAKFLRNALEGHPLVVHGTGSQSRDFIYVKDVVEATIESAEGKSPSILDVGTGVETSVSELAYLVKRVVGQDLEIVYSSPREGDLQESRASISGLQELGFRPRYSLEEGLKETWEWLVRQ